MGDSRRIQERYVPEAGDAIYAEGIPVTTTIATNKLIAASVRTSFYDNAVEVLGLPIDLDGRTATHPREARGTAFMNVVLLKGPTRALLADTGLTAQLPEITSWLDSAIHPDLPLSVFPRPLTEFDSVFNVVALAQRYRVDHLYASQFQGFPWFDFRVDGYGQPWTDTMDFEKAPRSGQMALGPDGSRDLEIFQPELALLQTYWIFYAATGAMLTSDAFVYVKDRAVQYDRGLSERDKDDIRRHMVGKSFLVASRRAHRRDCQLRARSVRSSGDQADRSRPWCDPRRA